MASKPPKPPKVTPAPQPKDEPQLDGNVDPEALRQAALRAEKERKARGKQSLRLDLTDPASAMTSGSGIYIP